MRRYAEVLSVLAFVAAGLLFAGCGEKPVEVTVSWDVPPKVLISPNIKRVGVAELSSKSTLEGKQFGCYAANKLEDDLKQTGRYELVDQRRIKQIMDQKDLNDALADNAQAAEVGKLADVQAMIYGHINVDMTEDKSGGTTVGGGYIAGISHTFKSRDVRCAVTIDFTMDNIATGKPIEKESYNKSYNSKDSEDKKKYKTKPQPEKVVNDLIDEAVQDFVGRIAPHKVSIKVELDKAGENKQVETGNKYAKASEYQLALDCYVSAISQNSTNAAAQFNAGVVNEAMGNISEALICYQRATAISPEQKYINAKSRVAKRTK